MQWEDWRGDEAHTRQSQYVIVSATVVPYSGPETYIFAAHKAGDIFEVTDWMELDGSYRGELNHTKALSNAGYQVIS